MTVNFQRPTLVAGVIISGPALIVHDDAKMQKGEACTTVYRFDRVKGPQQELVSFMCTPASRAATTADTARCDRTVVSSDIMVLTEYQFANDTEAHLLPAPPR